MVTSLVLILCMNYSIYGWVEGILWSGLRTKAFPWNEHNVFTLQRLVLGATVLLATQFTLLEGVWTLLVTLPMFFFFHDGAYYLTRNEIDSRVYPERWFDESETSSANWATMNSNWRIVLFILGVALATITQYKLGF